MKQKAGAFLKNSNPSSAQVQDCAALGSGQTPCRFTDTNKDGFELVIYEHRRERVSLLNRKIFTHPRVKYLTYFFNKCNINQRQINHKPQCRCGKPNPPSSQRPFNFKYVTNSHEITTSEQNTALLTGPGISVESMEFSGVDSMNHRKVSRKGRAANMACGNPGPPPSGGGVLFCCLFISWPCPLHVPSPGPGRVQARERREDFEEAELS